MQNRKSTARGLHLYCGGEPNSLSSFPAHVTSVNSVPTLLPIQRSGSLNTFLNTGLRSRIFQQSCPEAGIANDHGVP